MPTGPKAMERTFVQGGAFVFEGSKELYGHYDFSSGTTRTWMRSCACAFALRPICSTRHSRAR